MQKELNVYQNIRVKLILSLIAGGVILVFGFLLSAIPTMIVSQGWSTTEGIVISCILQGTSFKEYDGDYHTETKVYIRYQYSVNGITYSSSSVNSIDTPFSLYPSIYANRYPIEKNVLVYYNPKNPSKAVLEPGFVLTPEAFNIYSLLVSGAGLYIISRGLSGLREVIKRNKNGA